MSNIFDLPVDEASELIHRLVERAFGGACEHAHTPDECETSIVGACEYGDVAAIDRMIAGGADPSADDNYAIQIAAKHGQLGAVDRLMQDERVDPAANSNRSILLAAAHGRVSVVARLLADARVDPSCDRSECFMAAAENGHLDVVEMLAADPRVDPADQNNYALVWSHKQGFADVARFLLEDVRVVDGMSADLVAAVRGMLEFKHSYVRRIVDLESVGAYELISMG